MAPRVDALLHDVLREAQVLRRERDALVVHADLPRVRQPRTANFGAMLQCMWN